MYVAQAPTAAHKPPMIAVATASHQGDPSEQGDSCCMLDHYGELARGRLQRWGGAASARGLIQNSRFPRSRPSEAARLAAFFIAAPPSV